MVKMRPPKVRQPKPSKELESEAPTAESSSDPPKDNEGPTTLQRIMRRWPPNSFGS